MKKAYRLPPSLYLKYDLLQTYSTNVETFLFDCIFFMKQESGGEMVPMGSIDEETVR